MRSIKLRHQNGQVHTIPFGQLGQITNFSRDWITAKFNLRFAGDTDIEKLRKAAKKIGAEMMEVPAIKADIQREAVKRMFNVFPAMGIKFAKEGAAVVVQAAPASLERTPAQAAPATGEIKGTPTLAAAG